MTPHPRLARSVRHAALAALLVGGSALLSGCGYSSGSSGSDAARPAKSSASRGYAWGNIYRQGIRTIAVPAFQTKSFSRGDEISLSQALVAQIESRTPYKVVPPERADTILEGMVVSVGVGTVSNDNYTAIPQEHLYTISVDFTWKDLRTGQILVERRNFDQSGTYYPTLGEGRFTGRQSVSEALAASIVDELQGEW